MKDEALKLALEALEIQAYNSGDEKYTQAITAIKQALAAPVQEPVKFLANGTRFKTSEFPYGVCINGLPKELSGRWVALVAAEDDCHLKLTTPPAQPAPVQEPFGYVYEVYCLPECACEMEWVESFDRYEPDAAENIRNVTPVYTTPPAAQPAPVQPVADLDAWNLISRLNSALEAIGDYAHDKSTGPAVPDALWEIRSMAYEAIEDTTPPAQPAVPDAFGMREGEHPQYIQGWNDCRAEMLKGMK